MTEKVIRGFLFTTGIIYIALGFWCAILPQQSSEAVGFKLQTGQGQSEFLTVYGGLEVGIGLLFLVPILMHGDLRTVLLGCLVIHAGLVCFRTISFCLYTGLIPTTYMLAAVEWLIFLSSGLLFCRYKPDH
ncbi:MAG: hypothetical protein VX738_04835 [Planctomycetota bacterium]|nr:hypothetical protein [Planctomycetota bacterium]